MDFSFERGSAESPRGHALIYFQNSQDAAELLATYLVILPIQVDVSKYVPPFLMNQLGDAGAKDLSAFAFPPAPEPVSGLKYIQSLAETREDDVIFGGSISTSDVTLLLGMINAAIGWYSELCSDHTDQAISADGETASADADGLSVNDVLYGLMSDQDKLSELTRLVGRLRDAVGSGDLGLASETRMEIMTLGRHLPESHQVTRLADTAGTVGENAGYLANLYLQRCFHLMAEEYVMLGKVEDEIRVIEEGDG